MRIFLDTNVLVSALATRGLCADVLREVLISHQLVISDPLLTELTRILGEKIETPKDIIEEAIELFRRDAHHVHSVTSLEIDIQDKDDIIILSSVLQGNTDLFITGDRELLELGKVDKMEIVSPRGFWEKIKANTSGN